MLKLFEMFAGFGGASFALKKAGTPFECIGYSEIDKAAIKCYEQNFPDIKNFGDCTKINTEELPDFDLLTGGFPCQDVSIAGQRDLNKGRTNLYLEILRIAKAKQPKHMLLENVTGLLSMGKKGDKLNSGLLIDKIVRDLKSTGYGVCWKVLNSKDYGIPQNRERVWIVCKLGGWGFAEFQFPNKIPLKIFVKDLLELNVDAKYNLTEKQIKLIEERLNTSYESKFNPKISNSLRTNYGNGFSNETYVNGIQFDMSGKGYNSQQDRIYDADGVMQTIRDDARHNILIHKTRNVSVASSATQESNIVFDNRYKDKGRVYWGVSPTLNSHGDTKGGITTPIVMNYLPQNLDVRRCLQSGEPKEVLVMPNKGEIQKVANIYPSGGQAGNVYDSKGLSPSLTPAKRGGMNAMPIVMNCLTEAQGRQGSSKEFLRASQIVSETVKYGKHQQDVLHNVEGVSPTIPAGTHGSTPHLLKFNTQNVYRRLTPRECFRLQGFVDDEIKLEGLSDSAKYKLAGNGWEIGVASLLFKQLSLTFQHSA